MLAMQPEISPLAPVRDLRGLAAMLIGPSPRKGELRASPAGLVSCASLLLGNLGRLDGKLQERIPKALSTARRGEGGESPGTQLRRSKAIRSKPVPGGQPFRDENQS